ncbi:endonuclease/exonuclease/phosphatase family protein [Pseudomonas sp. T8]|uniref:endonuclease/exonuclease/phosphatase family protein n=1 Tax=Pseudomonas sp. T8 TaxID=645292 RepID=UPI002147E771|nr:endonuclease/exonuclease/phosphatase family protein [Pseudomonas sp. T8]UUT22430.1 endonuclease/exonuclease/phosphatase family protein [Pseudomonas sp. T8]
MSTRVRVASFNVENLFNRYAILDKPWEGRNYEKMIQAVGLVSLAGRDGSLVDYATTHTQRNNTAEVILEAEPDVLLLCEVENIHTLRIFNHDYLSDYFDQIVLIDGNDPRGIDVGLLVRKGFSGKIDSIRTHVNELKSGATGSVTWGSRPNFGYLANNALFSRDCLEVDVTIGDHTLCFLGNHFKAQDGKTESDERRKAQADRVFQIFSEAKRNRFPIVLGDLNADIDRGTAAGDSLLGLVKGFGVVDAFSTESDRWTHFYDYGSDVSRLDYILVDDRLALGDRKIIRKGLSKRCKQYTGPRYPTVSFQHTEASDHCLISVDIDF